MPSTVSSFSFPPRIAGKDWGSLHQRAHLAAFAGSPPSRVICVAGLERVFSSLDAADGVPVITIHRTIRESPIHLSKASNPLTVIIMHAKMDWSLFSHTSLSHRNLSHPYTKDSSNTKLLQASQGPPRRPRRLIKHILSELRSVTVEGTKCLCVAHFQTGR